MNHLYLLLLCPWLSLAQNYIPANGEIVNFGDLDLNSIISPNNWSSAKNPIGRFSNYGVGRFTNNGNPIYASTTSARWIDGYVKHYATVGNTSHVYPVGGITGTSQFEPLFLSTSGETIGHTISVAWVEGSYNIGSLGSGIASVSSKGRWDWIASATPTNLVISVKLPSTLQGGIASKNYLRLVGWNGTSWVNLSSVSPYNNGSDTNGILSGVVNSSITAIGIGSTMSGLAKGTAQAGTNITNMKTLSSSGHFKIHPNPSQGSITLDYNLDYDGNATVSLVDGNGKVIKSLAVEISKGANSLTIDVGSVAKGVYFVQLRDSTDNLLAKSQKIILE